MLCDPYKLLYSEQAIHACVKQLAQEIGEWAKKVASRSDADILALPVLRGGLFFFADLTRAMEVSVEMELIKAVAYEAETNKPRSAVLGDISQIPAKGRAVLIVDDICDSGRTLKILTRELLAAGAAEVKSAVLIKREVEEESFEPDWVGFRYSGAEWFVGYGMDHLNRFRNLPSIYIVPEKL